LLNLILSMDVVIPLGRGSLHDNMELRYCLRSLHKFCPDVENVFIIGQCPSFLINVIHIPFQDNSDKRFIALNIYKKIMCACSDKRVSDNFYFFSDDHFLLSEFTGLFFNSGSLSHAVNMINLYSSYYHTIENTYNYLKKGNNFNVHCPIIYNKEKFIHSVGKCNWKTPYGYAIKSVYCNLNELTGPYIADLKIKMNLKKEQIYALIKGRPFFSIGDTAVNKFLKEVLEELYPEKSPYES
jgi:hypothetical protein